MRKLRFWKTDWFLGAMVALVVLVASRSDIVQRVESTAYDLGVQASTRAPLDRIAIIAIDDASVANLGRWPWPRSQHARLTDLLAAADARLIVNTVFFSEPQQDPGYLYITRLTGLYQQAFPQVAADGSGAPSPAVALMGRALQDAEYALNTDRQLAKSFGQSGRVVLPMVFQLGEPRGNPDRPLPAFATRHRLASLAGDGEAPAAQALDLPIDVLGQTAVALGHLNAMPDVDGGIRAEPLVVRYYDQYFPSLALATAASALNLAPDDVRVDLGREVKLGTLRIPTDSATRMHTFFYRGRDGASPFPVDSFYDVVSGRIPAAKYRDKIVLVGATAAGVGSSQVTPVSPSMAPVETLAHTVSSILGEHFFVVPAWGVWAELAIYLLVAAYLMVLLPRLTAGLAAVLTGSLLMLLVGAHFGLMVGGGIWLQLMASVLLLIVGHLMLTTKRFLVTERGKEQSDAQSAESSRMLALAFQGQGQLDMAWDKFRQVPLGDAVMDNLYNLALDFERKRQFNKAETVFRHMASHDPGFKDLAQRLARAQKLSETVILGTPGAHPGGPMVVASDVEKPMLGRYQIEKELGKGAMGIVYQGRDPKINRIVAIKTMALSQEFEPDELADVKARFFREAETAGRLNHPNIVTIFDAGEEHDLAYIAMEFLKGHDLVPQTKPDALLPLARVVTIVARVADALHYAHANNVVHRDIKPANIMYEPTADQVKVTDFGIARITDASRTKTGMVLGTPSYMSPEQLAGQRIDGRSDLYSLGVTMFQLCCGRQPFTAESLAQLMYKIANEPPPDIRTINPRVPPMLAAVIAKSLVKPVAQRFQTGAEMAAALRNCLAKPATAAPAAPSAPPPAEKRA